MNYIEEKRRELKQDLEKNAFQKGDVETQTSPTGQFSFSATTFSSVNVSHELSQIEVFDENLNQKLVEFIVNESQIFYGWAKVDNTEYLICAEDIFGGQTIIDLSNRQMAGYSPNEDGFIWTDFYVSPNGRTLATIGCYWGSSYFIKLFDFSKPLQLPLPEIGEIELLGNDEVIVSWLNNTTLKMKGVKREEEREYFEGGSFRWKTLSETPIEREIDVSGFIINQVN